MKNKLKKQIRGVVTSALYAGVLMVASSALMSAEIVSTFYGADNGADPAGVNSEAAQTAYFSAIGATSPTITFEGVASLANVDAAGDSVTLTGAAAGAGGLQTSDMHSGGLGYNTTPGGNTWLQVFPDFNSAGESVTFNFANPVSSFGAFLTDTESAFPGDISVAFNDGSAESFGVTKTDTKGSVYFAFTDDSTFTSLTISTGATASSRDVWGIDDITVAATPEPGTFGMLLGAGLVSLCFKARRHFSR